MEQLELIAYVVGKDAQRKRWPVCSVLSTGNSGALWWSRKRINVKEIGEKASARALLGGGEVWMVDGEKESSRLDLRH